MMSKERINVFSGKKFIYTMSSQLAFLTSQSEELKPSSDLPSFSEIHLFTGAGYVCPCLSDKI